MTKNRKFQSEDGIKDDYKNIIFAPGCVKNIQLTIVLDQRKGAWLVQDDNPEDNTTFHAVHWATVIQGLQLAWEEDKDKKNK